MGLRQVFAVTEELQKKEESNDDFFKGEFNDLDLEDEFNKNSMFPGADVKKNNPFG